jgi:hypothetical protein
MRAAFGEAAIRWRSEASAARPIPRAIAEHSRALVSASAAACQAALQSTAADRRRGGSPGSQVLQTATAYGTTGFAAYSANPPSERAATLCGPLDLARRRLMASIAMWRRIRVGRRRPSRSAWKPEAPHACASQPPAIIGFQCWQLGPGPCRSFSREGGVNDTRGERRRLGSPCHRGPGPGAAGRTVTRTGPRSPISTRVRPARRGRDSRGNLGSWYLSTSR